MNSLMKIICSVFGHNPEMHVKTGPSGDIIKYYKCGRCDMEVTKEDWIQKWRI